MTINSLISDYETNPMVQQQMMQQMQQQMMQQQMMQQMQQQMMQQQMMEQQMMQQQMMQQQMMDEQNKYKEFTFHHIVYGKRKIKIKIGSTVKELFNKYKKEIYSLSNKTLTFLYNAVKISENDNRKVEDVFKFNNTTIIVMEI